MIQSKKIPNIENLIKNLNQEKEKINLAFVDCSGSIQPNDFQTFLYELINFKNALKSSGNPSEKFMVVFVAHDIKGDPVDVNEVTITQYLNGKLPFLIGGGSDLSKTIKQATQLDFFKDKTIKSLMCFTDLFDNPPKFKELGLVEGTPVIYISAPATTKESPEMKEVFTNGVKDYAKVINIGEGVKLIMEQNNNLKISKSKI